MNPGFPPRAGECRLPGLRRSGAFDMRRVTVGDTDPRFNTAPDHPRLPAADRLEHTTPFRSLSNGHDRIAFGATQADPVRVIEGSITDLYAAAPPQVAEQPGLPSAESKGDTKESFALSDAIAIGRFGDSTGHTNQSARRCPGSRAPELTSLLHVAAGDYGRSPCWSRCSMSGSSVAMSATESRMA